MNPFSYMVIAPMSREILANADRLPDAELMRISGALRTLADECMMVVNRRLGSRPKPHLVIDNTRPAAPQAPAARPGVDRAG